MVVGVGVPMSMSMPVIVPMSMPVIVPMSMPVIVPVIMSMPVIMPVIMSVIMPVIFLLLLILLQINIQLPFILLKSLNSILLFDVPIAKARLIHVRMQVGDYASNLILGLLHCHLLLNQIILLLFQYFFRFLMIMNELFLEPLPIM